MALYVTVQNTKFSVGDTVRVHYRIVEKIKTAGKTKRSVKEEIKQRIQPFEGVVIAVRGSGENKSFTVRKNGADGVGVERIFPVQSPWIDKIDLKQPAKTRRSKLYYIRPSK